LRKQNRELFQETLLLQSSYKYSSAIDIKGEQYYTEALILSLIFEQRKLIKKKKLIKNPTRQS
jgi:acid stress-induced BolA-like protein IbaG/YrbA